MDTGSGRTTMIMIAVGAAAITVAYRLGRRHREPMPEALMSTLAWLQQGQQDLHRGQIELRRGQVEINKRLDARTQQLALMGEQLVNGQRTQLEAVAGAWGAVAERPAKGELHRLRQVRSPRS